MPSLSCHGARGGGSGSVEGPRVSPQRKGHSQEGEYGFARSPSEATALALKVDQWAFEEMVSGFWFPWGGYSKQNIICRGTTGFFIATEGCRQKSRRIGGDLDKWLPPGKVAEELAGWRPGMVTVDQAVVFPWDVLSPGCFSGPVRCRLNPRYITRRTTWSLGAGQNGPFLPAKK